MMMLKPMGFIHRFFHFHRGAMIKPPNYFTKNSMNKFNSPPLVRCIFDG